MPRTPRQGLHFAPPARHGLASTQRKAAGGREAHEFIRGAAVIERLLVAREREFTAWRERWRATLEGVYAGAVALRPGLTGDLLAAYRAPERVVCQR